MKAQALQSNSLQSHMIQKKILEINKEHPIIKTLKKNMNIKTENEVKDMVLLMYDIACVSSGFTLKNTNEFSKKLYRILEIGMCSDDETEVEKEQIQEGSLKQEDKDDENEMEKVD